MIKSPMQIPSAFLGLLLYVATAHAADWPSWRGPAQTGVAAETDLVASWSPTGENLVWRADFTGRSTPTSMRW